MAEDSEEIKETDLPKVEEVKKKPPPTNLLYKMF